MNVLYIVILSYMRPLNEIDAHLPEHIEWLDKGYAEGVFLASGRRIPRIGGVIIAKAESLESLQERMREDPFQRLGLSKADILPFEPSRCVEAFKAVLA
ncbi:YciI family protein [Brucella pseudogrignonensis]|jgi:uncharacterized protein YciI|uniref:YCII-related domain-containing protein n=1 Tax=Brucella pseudogrignonensis TaxID=419475 RepID=A0A7Y3WZT9_9HYPH|nr:MULTISPECIES: YciI family protein [Brucella]MBO1027106.1 hypothetical protein [Ochrobactrum sp. SD129]KAB2689432.1 hypothetical protein F9K82_12560 [Brucella pseudogrignonensis]MCD4512290.1 YciI family protein [Brucella pseudogrignonensis]MCM0753067.1 hypothetical protein [Brucella pseudogrignonensis]NKX17099.1 hypothetical protein [Brucella pseudogrignonensis]